jgi:ClpP class serine protease
MNGKTSSVGSIGVMMTAYSFKKYYENAGIEEHTVVSPGSPDKNKAFFDMLEGNYKAIEAKLEEYRQIFVNTVVSARPSISKEALTGDMYLAEAAIDKAMADDYGDIETGLRYLYNN